MATVTGLSTKFSRVTGGLPTRDRLGLARADCAGRKYLLYEPVSTHTATKENYNFKSNSVLCVCVRARISVYKINTRANFFPGSFLHHLNCPIKILLFHVENDEQRVPFIWILAVTRGFGREYLTFNKYCSIIFIVYVYMAFCLLV